ncbi:MAG: hypothetical protein DLM60_12390 [Pseudonocardiales bacterium]|nr:MAG: hypothetical protein DLM60_12390 [Pseudonocardiales bacterium]
MEIHAGNVDGDIPVITQSGVHAHEIAVQSVQAAQRPRDQFSDGTIVKHGIHRSVVVGCLGRR